MQGVFKTEAFGTELLHCHEIDITYEIDNDFIKPDCMLPSTSKSYDVVNLSISAGSFAERGMSSCNFTLRLNHRMRGKHETLQLQKRNLIHIGENVRRISFFRPCYHRKTS